MNKTHFIKSAEKTVYHIKSARLPKEFDGFKIAHISDFHSHPACGTADIIADFAPDIIAVTGDLVHDDRFSYGEVSALLKRLIELAPIYIVSGNHDLWRPGIDKIFNEFREIGAVILDNDSKTVTHGDAEIALFGVRDPFSRVPKVISDDINSSFDSLDLYSGYKILLFHRANLYPEIKNRGFDLILSGHMHGGQIQIPHIGGLAAPTSSILSKNGMLFPKYCKGIYNENASTMIVNAGNANTLPIPRFFNPPEVGCITLFSDQA